MPHLEQWRDLASEHGIELQFTEGYRTAEVQAKVQGTGAVRPAKVSLHQTGFAVDISIRGLTQSQLRLVVDLARQAGLRWGGYFNGNYDPYHFYRDPGGNRAQQAKEAESRYRQLVGQ